MWRNYQRKLKRGVGAYRIASSFIYLTIIPWARVGYEMVNSAITNLISNKREWNNCFIKFSPFGYCCWSLLNFHILRKNFLQIKTTGCWGNLRPKRAKRNDHMTRATLCERSWMKNRKRSRSDTVGHLKFKKRLNVRIITFLRLAFKCFWSSSSSRSVIVVHSRAKEEIRARTAFFMLNWIPRGRFTTLQASPSVRGTISLRQAFSASF